MRTSDITKRYLRVFDAASDDTRKAGREWYAYAREAATDLAKGTFYTVAQTAGVIAVLSPRLTWAKNLSAARKVIDSHMSGECDPKAGGGLTANVVKAYRVLDGDLNAVTGPKVTAFYAGIMGDESAVVVDSWMLLAALGTKWERGKMGEDVARKWMPTQPERRAIEAAIRNGAAHRDVSPIAFQAVVWVQSRQKAH